MGMDISANITVGVVVYEQEGELNNDFEIPEEYEDGLVEYLFNEFEEDGVSVNIAGNSEYPTILIGIDKYTTSVDWTATAIMVDNLANLDLELELEPN